MDGAAFQSLVWERGRELYRDMPWRDEPTFYHVLVSEVMLQQTQVSRVLVKYEAFMQAFPTIESLAAASLADVLRIWSGLGYNRRAKYLHEAAKQISLFSVKDTLNALMLLPGVGRHTAGALMNYVYEVPTAFIETNIRTVYFNHFFHDRTDVTDRELLELVEATIDREHPREWFWALMDYGASLKASGAGRLDQSRHYHRQSPLAGSIREVRGRIIAVLKDGPLELAQLKSIVSADNRFESALQGLERDGLVQRSGARIDLTK